MSEKMLLPLGLLVMVAIPATIGVVAYYSDASILKLVCIGHLVLGLINTLILLAFILLILIFNKGE